VTNESFDLQMRYLSLHYHVVSLEELLQTIRQRNAIRKNTCVITFDDGWKDTYTHAFPIIMKYNLPSTVFLVSGYIGTSQWFWPDKILYLLTKALGARRLKGTLSKIFPPVIYRSLYEAYFKPNPEPAQMIEETIERLKSRDEDERERVIRELQAAVEVEEPELSRSVTMDWDEVRRMDCSNITFGSHTKMHTILTKVSKEDAKNEIVGSKQEIEKRISKPCSAFCYPNGDYDNKVKRLVEGYYSCAFTTRNGFVSHGDDLFALNRIGIHNDMAFTKPLFACTVSGIMNSLGM